MGKTNKTKHGALVRDALDALQISVTDFANLFPVDAALVYQWRNDSRPVAAKHAARFEEVTKGRVTRVQLHPEIFS